MFYNLQMESERKEYLELLEVIGSLSSLFSESKEPYLYYRAAENIFCRAFKAENLSRGDVSVDATKNKIGIGLKTFIHGNGRTLQKIAEFNSKSELYLNQDPRDAVEIISNMRNDRMAFTERAHGLNEMIYHVVTRKENSFHIYEEPMYRVDLSTIRDIKENKNSIFFRDKYFEYNFYKPKSTLFKRFITESALKSINVTTLNDPFAFLLDKRVRATHAFREITDMVSKEKNRESIYLPLYSSREFEVHKKSGLNQWNASGRIRHPDELYIPIPAWIHRDFSGFFPFNPQLDRESQPFSLRLPNHEEISAKVCQQGGKALMSNPNKLLGKWLLRDVLQVPRGKLVTYKMLEHIGVDSVVITKNSKHNYAINFASIGSYEVFEGEYRKS